MEGEHFANGEQFAYDKLPKFSPSKIIYLWYLYMYYLPTSFDKLYMCQQYFR